MAIPDRLIDILARAAPKKLTPEVVADRIAHTRIGRPPAAALRELAAFQAAKP